MKIYIMTDLEGAAGVVAFDRNLEGNETSFNLRHAQQGRLLTGEVNAAVEGCFSAGADEVLIDDSHGGGYIIDYENIDGRAKILHGTKRPGMMAGLNASFDGVVFVGAHSMIGTHRGVLSHTMSSKDIRQVRINGNPIGEIGIFALRAGTFGVPMVFVSGDTAACKEAARFIPGITTVAVKEGLARTVAVSLSSETAREKIREGIARSLADLSKVKPYKLKPPFTYQEDLWPETLSKGEQYASHPDNLPKEWTTSPLIKANSAAELLKKVYGKKV
ncbi:MAG: M55 family metallopeptidase [Candidatus Firestonebacteria bacterium]